MSLLNKLKSTDLSSFNYTKVETSRSEPSNVKNLPTPPTRVTKVTTTKLNEPTGRGNFSKLAITDRGSNDVKQPSDFYLNMHRFNDGFGNIGLQVIKTAEDVKRWAKWTITPKGLLFNIKQAVLQRFNANSKTRIYNPLGVLGSIVPLVHLPRHTRGTFVDFKDPPKFPDTHYQHAGAASSFRRVTENFEDNTLETDFVRNSDFRIRPPHIPPVQPRGTKILGGYDAGTGNYAHVRVSDDNKLYGRGVSNTLQVPYHGTKDNKSTAKLPIDYIRFRIRDLVNHKWLVFPAHLGTVTDTVTPGYTPEKYIGRPDSVHVYNGTDRSVSFDFKVVAFTKQEIPIIQEKMNYLVGLGYPTYKKMFEGDSESRPVAPYVSLSIGDLFNDTPGYFSGITVTIEEGATWDIDHHYQIPQFFNVSCDFVHIGKYLPQTLGKHYEVPHLTDYGVGDGARGTFTEDYDETGWDIAPVENTLRPGINGGKYTINKHKEEGHKNIISQIDNVVV